MSHSASGMSMGKYVRLILSMLIFLTIVSFIIKGCSGKKDPEESMPAMNMEPAMIDSAASTAVSTHVTLPNGKSLDALKGGMEDMMVIFLNDPAARPGKDVWFDFNELNFKFGTAEILPTSQRQLNNLTEILKAYPNAKIKIGGYTDNVGGAEANKKLSQERADAVLGVLTTSGLSTQLLGAEGYGSDFAKFPSDAPETDRVKDRRVSVSVREK